MGSFTKWATNYSSPKSIGARLRARRTAWLIHMIIKNFSRYGAVNIIDIGGTRTYWNVIPKEILTNNKVTITILNLPGAPLPKNDEIYRFVEGDGCDLGQYENNQFHIAHSNSVIEHIGNWNKMKNFASEIRRVARDLFMQTPYFWFPVEPHFMTPFFHWLPAPVRVSLLMRFSLGHYPRARNINDAIRAIEGIALLDMKMFTELFPDATIFKERILFITKSLIAVRCHLP